MRLSLVAYIVTTCFLVLPGTACETTPDAASGSAWAPKRTTGDIAFVWTPRGLEDGHFVIDVKADTHSGELADLNLGKLVKLQVYGRTISPASATGLKGHHSSAQVRFGLSEAPTEFTLEIDKIGDVPGQTLTWP